jgi:hypothetical protein
MTVWAWFIVGVAVSAAQVLTQWWTVNRLQPGAQFAVVQWTVVGVLGRLLVTAVVFLVALSDSITGGLLAFCGWWVGRWSLIIWLGR